MKLDCTIYEFPRIIRVSLNDKTGLRDHFVKSNFKDVNILSDSSKPN